MVEDSSSTPPNSVIILPGVSQDEIEPRRQATSGVQESDSIKNYLHVRSQKPGNGSFVLSAVFFVLPFVIFLSSDDVLDAIPICCLFLLISFVLFSINFLQIMTWGKEMKKARKRIEDTEKIPYPPVAQWPQIAGTLSILGGFIAADYEGILFLIGAGIGLAFFLYYTVLVQRQEKTFDQLIEELI